MLINPPISGNKLLIHDLADINTNIYYYVILYITFCYNIIINLKIE